MLSKAELNKLLILSRIEHFRPVVIETLSSKNETLKSLISYLNLLVNDIINIDLKYASTAYRESSKTNFAAILDKLAGSNNIIAVINLGNHILQYYTLMTTIPTAVYQSNVIELKKYIDAQAQILGSYSTNPLIIKLILIKSYNTLDNIISNKCIMSTDAKKLNDIIKILKLLFLDIESLFTDKNENNIFYHFLLYMYHYTMAKAYEAYASLLVNESMITLPSPYSQAYKETLLELQSTLSLKEKLLTHAQHGCLAKAYKAIDSIGKCQGESSEYLTIGYALGMKLFDRMPVSDIRMIIAHTKSLVEDSTFTESTPAKKCTT